MPTIGIRAQLERFLSEPFRLEPAATGDSGLRERYRRPLTHDHGGRRAGAADRVREPRQSAAGARLGATPRAQPARRARRVATAHRAAAADREPAARRAPGRCSAWCSRSGAAACSCASCRPRRTRSSSTCRSTGASSASRRPSRCTTAILFGMAPALRGTRVQPNDALKAQGRGVVGDGADRSRPHAHRPAGRAVARARRGGGTVHPHVLVAREPCTLGFDSRPILVASMEMPGAQHRSGQAARAVPATDRGGRRRPWRVERGVVGDDAARQQHLEQPHRAAGWPAAAGGRSPDVLQHGERRVVSRPTARRCSPDATSRAPTRRTRPRVAIVNEAFARRFTGGRNPIGTRVRAQGATA